MFYIISQDLSRDMLIFGKWLQWKMLDYCNTRVVLIENSNFPLIDGGVINNAGNPIFYKSCQSDQFQYKIKEPSQPQKFF